MACFLVPAAEAVVVGAVYLAAKHRERKIETPAYEYQAKDGSIKTGEKVKLSRKLGWLMSLLFGGSFLLAYEHVWHGEVVPWFPFLTNAVNPADAQEMLHEMATAGVMMAVLVTVIWLGMVAVSNYIEKKTMIKKLNESIEK